MHVSVPDSTNSNVQGDPSGTGGKPPQQKSPNGVTASPSVAPGKDGADGSKILMGKTEPDALVGQIGDMYLNTLTGDIYQKKTGKGWEPQGNIKGTKGDRGEKGDASHFGFGTDNPTAQTLQIGDLYLNTTTGGLFTRLADGTIKRLICIHFQGDGFDGNRFLTEARGPQATDGEIGDVFFNSLTADLYKKLSDGSWRPVAYLKGDKGDKGDRGAKGEKGSDVIIHTGSGKDSAAAKATPIDGLFLDAPSGDLFTKLPNGTLEFLMNIKGPQGKDGTDGTNGHDGTIIWPGKDKQPAAGLGRPGDFYINQLNGDVYKKEADGTWVPYMNIMGPKGADGAAGKQTNNVIVLFDARFKLETVKIGNTQLGFDTDVPTPNKVSTVKIGRIADLLNTYQKSIAKISIIGHCDKQGTKAYNLNLSLRRAKAVRGILINHGVQATLIQECRGEGAPEKSDSDCNGDACPKDRRVDIDINLVPTLTGLEKFNTVETLNKSFEGIWTSQ